MKGYVAYLRKSLDEKGKQVYSIEVQKKTIKDMAEKYNIKIKHFLKPENRSGGDKNRPIFNKMLEMVRNGEYDGIAAYSVDRLTRNLTNADDILDLIIEGDADLFIATMPGMNWKSIEGVTVFVSFSMIGVIERLMAKMRTKRTSDYLRAQGKHMSQVPYGYRRKWINRKKKEYVIEIVEEEAEKIKTIYKLALEAKIGRRKIAKILGLEEGHVRSILENERYTGYTIVNDEIVKLELPPIIPIDAFCALHPEHKLCKARGEISPEKNRE